MPTPKTYSYCQHQNRYNNIQHYGYQRGNWRDGRNSWHSNMSQRSFPSIRHGIKRLEHDESDAYAFVRFWTNIRDAYICLPNGSSLATIVQNGQDINPPLTLVDDYRCAMEFTLAVIADIDRQDHTQDLEPNMTTAPNMAHSTAIITPPYSFNVQNNHPPPLPMQENMLDFGNSHEMTMNSMWMTIFTIWHCQQCHHHHCPRRQEQCYQRRPATPWNHNKQENLPSSLSTFSTRFPRPKEVSPQIRRTRYPRDERYM